MIIEMKKQFEVDDKIAQHIKNLNNKGYVTEYCCSGHPEKPNLGYILFDSSTSLDIQDYEIEPPEDWFYIQLPNDRRIGIYMKGSGNKEFIYSGQVTDEYIDDKLNKLEEWVNSLETHHKGYNIKIYYNKGEL